MLTIVGMVLGSLLGTVLAAGQLTEFAPLRWACIVFVGGLPGVPPLVQLIFWYNLAYLLPRIAVGVPFGPELFSWPTNDVITPLTAAIIGLSLHEAAYMAEIIRAGILSVDSGQRDAASKAMGFSALALVLARRPAAGDARHHPADGLAGDRAHEGHVARQRDRDGRPAALGAGHLQPHVRSGADADGRCDLVPRGRHRSDARAARVERHFSRGMSQAAVARRVVERTEAVA